MFTYQGSQYAHTLNGASLHLVALSNNRLAFSGTGVYGGTPAVNWTIKGQIINGKYVKAVISYDAPSTYKVAISGVIKPDGSLSGPADSAGQAGLTFAMPAGSFTSVLSYQAKVQSEKDSRGSQRDLHVHHPQLGARPARHPGDRQGA